MSVDIMCIFKEFYIKLVFYENILRLIEYNNRIIFNIYLLNNYRAFKN